MEGFFLKNDRFVVPVGWLDGIFEVGNPAATNLLASDRSEMSGDAPSLGHRMWVLLDMRQMLRFHYNSKKRSKTGLS